jgi:hypothetical protein
MTNIAAIAIVAGLLTPENPSSGVRMPEAKRQTNRIIEATSKET